MISCRTQVLSYISSLYLGKTLYVDWRQWRTPNSTAQRALSVTLYQEGGPDSENIWLLSDWYLAIDRKSNACLSCIHGRPKFNTKVTQTTQMSVLWGAPESNGNAKWTPLFSASLLMGPWKIYTHLTNLPFLWASFMFICKIFSFFKTEYVHEQPELSV